MSEFETHYPCGLPVPDGWHFPDGRYIVGSGISPGDVFCAELWSALRKHWITLNGVAQRAPRSAHFAGQLAAYMIEALKTIDMPAQVLFRMWYLDPTWISAGWHLTAALAEEAQGQKLTPQDVRELQQRCWNAGWYPSPAVTQETLPVLSQLALRSAFHAALLAGKEAELLGTGNAVTPEELCAQWAADRSLSVQSWQALLSDLLREEPCPR